MYTKIVYPLTLLSMIALSRLTLSAPQGIQIQVPGAYYCTSTNWAGGCAWSEATEEKCINIEKPSGTSFSFGPDKSLVCKLYESANCQAGGTVVGGIRYPGWPDVSAMTQNEGLSVARSWKCKSE